MGDNKINADMGSLTSARPIQNANSMGVFPAIIKPFLRECVKIPQLNVLCPSLLSRNNRKVAFVLRLYYICPFKCNKSIKQLKKY